MSLIGLLIVLAAIGLILWLILNFIPMPAPWKNIIIAVAVIGVVIYLLNVFGILGAVDDIRVP